MQNKEENKWWIKTKSYPVKSNSLATGNTGNIVFNWKRLASLLSGKKIKHRDSEVHRGHRELI